MSDDSAQAIGLRGNRGGLTATACAELVALDVLHAAGSTAVDGERVRRHIDDLQARDDIDERLAIAANRAQVVHVLKVAQAWQGGLAKTQRQRLT